jgi:hypothetical protein
MSWTRSEVLYTIYTFSMTFLSITKPLIFENILLSLSPCVWLYIKYLTLLQGHHETLVMGICLRNSIKCKSERVCEFECLLLLLVKTVNKEWQRQNVNPYSLRCWWLCWHYLRIIRQLSPTSSNQSLTFQRWVALAVPSCRRHLVANFTHSEPFPTLSHQSEIYVSM